MTRINCVDPQELSGKHLVAEYRELPRIFGLVNKAIDRGEKSYNFKQKKYILGTGHCKFFYSKLQYLNIRHQELVQEMINRGYKPNFKNNLKSEFPDIPNDWWNDWIPDLDDIEVNRKRIKDRS